MNVIKITVLAVLITVTHVFSQPQIVAMFTPHSHTYNGTTLPYRLFVPQNYDTTQVYPLVLALHGAGERGNDNLIHISSSRLATSWADPLNQVNYPCFVVAPQCPVEKLWNYWTVPIGPELATAANIIDSLFTVFPIDTNRFYVTGLSMGGFGTWDFIQRFPDKVAAAIPICAGGDSLQIANIVDVPIWNFHGKLDDVVPVSFSRNMISALENNDRPVVYTHCKYENCAGLPDSTISMFVESHAPHFYTEYANGGHNIWDQSYDYPHLFPWVFSKYRMVKNSINLINLNNYRVLSLIEDISWNAINQDGSVEIWFSPDAGQTWQIVTDSSANSGTYSWNTELVDDCAFGSIKILLKNEEGFIYGNSVSSYFAIDNAMNGLPFVKILNDEFDKGLVLLEDTLQLEVLMADPEQSSLLTTIYYSANGGNDFEIVNSFTSNSDSVSQFITFNVNALPNSNNTVIKLQVDDGQNVSADETFHFVKQSSRHSSFQATHVSGIGDASVNIQIIDPAQLTGDLYRISFDDSSYSQKAYNVFNVSSGQYVVQNVTQMNGIYEGPYFDGIRLLIKDFDPPEVNFQQTGWLNSATTLELSVYLPVINMGTFTLYGVPYPVDYQITITDVISDTSSTAFGSPAIFMKFMVENLTENRPAEVIFVDNDNNNELSLLDDLYFIERDSIGDPVLSWAIHVGGDPSPVMPFAGDQFLLETYKPVSADDIYEFTGEVSGIKVNLYQPDQINLSNNYPNPFNPTTTIEIELTQKVHVTLKIFNILGEEIATLVSGSLPSGHHAVKWNASNLASGVYLYRLQAGDYVKTRKMVLMK